MIEYTPYPGFVDLRNYKLSQKTFLKCKIIQETLFEMNSNAEYYKKYHPSQWQDAKEISAELQLFLSDKEQLKLF